MIFSGHDRLSAFAQNSRTGSSANSLRSRMCWYAASFSS